MIDPASGFHIDGFPNVSIFRDDRSPGAFYAAPDKPRLIVDASALPQMKLMLYGEAAGKTFQVKGGLFTCATWIGLAADERGRLTQVLQERIASEAQRQGTAPAKVTWVELNWVRGRSELRLTDKILLAGQPSLYGGNDCVFYHSLSADDAVKLEDSWANGLPDFFISYVVRAQMPPADFTFAGRPDTSAFDLSRLISRVGLPG